MESNQAYQPLPPQGEVSRPPQSSAWHQEYAPSYTCLPIPVFMPVLAKLTGAPNRYDRRPPRA